MIGEHIITRVVALWASRGLVLRFMVPGRAGIHTYYPKDNMQRSTWIRNAMARGWTLLP